MMDGDGMKKGRPSLPDAESYPDRHLMLRDVAAGRMTEKEIARKYGVSRSTVAAFKKKHSAELLRMTAYASSDAILAAISDNTARIEKLVRSLEEWFRDPDNPDGYTTAPRAEELDVIYTMEFIDEKGKRHQQRVKRNLQDLCDEMFSGFARNGIVIRPKTADQRLTLLKAFETLGKYVQIMIDAREALKEESDSEESAATIEELMTIIQTALAPYPEALNALMIALAERSGQGTKELPERL